MAKTKRGIYHNIKESVYCVTNGDVFFFFSSEVYLHKFLDGYEDHRNSFSDKMKKLTMVESFSCKMMSDMVYYRQVEKRGFYAWVKGVNINEKDMSLYALSQMNKNETTEWFKIERPKVTERKKLYVS